MLLLSKKNRREQMISFESDYIAGTHPQILKRLAETNMESLPGYGADPYCESAKEKIRAACGCPDAEVEFLVGGTQANAVIISTMLRDYEGVVAAKTGHVSTHEAGAIEYTGHEVLEVEQTDGKINLPCSENIWKAFMKMPTMNIWCFPACSIFPIPRSTEPYIRGRNWRR